MKEQLENEIFWQIFESQLNNDNYNFTYDSEEIWLDVPNYQGLYLISNYGRLKSLITNRILNPGKDSTGYLTTRLRKNKEAKTVRIHQLVVGAFLNHTPNRFELVVNHKDSNKLNNKLENLEIVTQRQNLSIERVQEKCDKIGCNLNPGVTKISDKFRIKFQIGDKKCHYGMYNDRNEANKLASKISNLIELNYTHREIVTKLKTKLSLNPKKIIKIINSHEE